MFKTRSQILNLETALIEYVEKYGATRQAKTALSQVSARKTQRLVILNTRNGILVFIIEAAKSFWHRALYRKKG